jgi:D-aspartate ligase
MFVSAQVLLEDHNPMLLGNPVAMITRPMPELWEKVGRMLGDIGWRGFANFDMKRDPETGRVLFMDFNPRIGANSYYACVGGVNPMRALVADFVDGTDEVMRIDRKGLYSRARPSLVRRYLTDPKLLAEFDEIVRGGNVADPMRYKGDSLASRSIGRLMELNYDRKFAKYYPVPTPDAF